MNLPEVVVSGDYRNHFKQIGISLRFSTASNPFRRLSAQKITNQVLKGLGWLKQRKVRFRPLWHTRIGSATPTASTRYSEALAEQWH